MKRDWNNALQSLALIKIGQEIGHDTRLARAIHDVIELLLAFTR